MKNHCASLFAFFLFTQTIACWGQGTQRELSKPIGALTDADGQIEQISEAQHLNIFLDATNLPTEVTVEVKKPDTSLSTMENVASYLASSYGLSTLSTSNDTLLLWAKPDALALAKRIVNGEKIRLLDAPRSQSSTEPQVAPIPTQDTKSVRSPIKTSEPWRLRFADIGEEILSTQQPVNEEPEPLRAEQSLSQLPLDVQQLALFSAQKEFLGSFPEPLRSLWLTDSSWQGVTLTLRQMPSPVRRRADLNKPAPLISILCLNKHQYLNAAGQSALASVGFAVVK